MGEEEENMAGLKRYMWIVGLVLLLPCATGLARAQGPQEGWQVYTNANDVNDLVLEGGGALGGGYTWAATDGGVVCYSASQQVKFTTADGLADNDVRTIAMDSGGRLWFGTESGVSVLDHGGTPFDKGDDAWATFTTADGLTDNDVRAVAVDGGNRLWFGTYGGGASVLNHGGSPFDKGDDTWTTFTTADGLADNYVQAIAVDGDVHLWFGTRGGGVSVLDHGGTPFDKGGDAWTTFTNADGLVSDYVWAIAVDGGNRLWFGTWFGGVSVLNDGGSPFDKGDDTWATFTESDGLADDDVRAIAVDGGGRLWFGTDNWGASVLDHGGSPFDKGDDTWTTFTWADGLANNYVQAIAVDGGNRLWFGTFRGVSVLNHGGSPFDKGDDTWATFTEFGGLADNDVGVIAVDSGGRLWFSTSRGVSVLDDGGSPFDKDDDAWTTFTNADGLAHIAVWAIAVDGGNRLWFGTESGVSVLNDGGSPFYKSDDTWTTFTTADGLADNRVSAIAVDGGNRLWFGTYGGVSVLDHKGTPFYKGDDTWTTFTTADGLASKYVEAIAVDGGNRLWLGTYDGGVSMLDHKGTPFYKGDDTWATFTESDGLADNDVYAIAVDSGGRLWFGTPGGVSVLDHGGTPFDKGGDAWTTFTTADGLASNSAYTIAADGGNRLWFGTWGGGVSVLDHGGTPFDKGDDTWATFTAADGLADNDVEAIATDDRGRWWFGTASGVSELVDAVAPASSVRSPVYANCRVSLPWSTSDGASHIFRVTLWVKYKSSGTWMKTTLNQRGQSTGAFVYMLAHGSGTYYFATVAEDWMGNVEAPPSGAGDSSAYYAGLCYIYHPVVLRNYRSWGPDYEDNDDWLAAYGPLASGRAYEAYPDDTEDYYYFILSAPATVRVSVANYVPTSSNGTVALYGPVVGDEEGPRIDYYGPPGHSSMSLGPHSLGKGKYYVRVRTANNYSTTQRYTLTVTY